MDFAFSDEQEELRQTVRSFLERRSTEADVRRLMEDERGYDAETWRLMAEQLGLHGLAVPEEYGGSGFSLVELGIVVEEMGRALLCGPFFASAVLAARAVEAIADRQACKTLLPGIASGETVATLAVTERSGHWTEDGVRSTAERTAHGWRLTGHKDYVLDGQVADVILVAARTPGGVSLFAVDAHAPQLRREALPTLDPTRRQAALDLDQVPARLLGEEGAAWPALRHTLDVAAVVLAAEQVGGAFAAVDMAVEHAKTRTQFGRVIGSFQAIKHQCADMLVAAESARATVHYALWSAATDGPDLPVVASGTKAYCSEAYTRCAEQNVQIHGGIGFTWEHSAHLHLKRAKGSEILFGSPREHRELVAQRAGFAR